MTKDSTDCGEDVLALRRIARDLCHGDQEAEDLEQELHLVALEEGGRGARSSRAWYYGVARNLRRSKLRANKTRRRHEAEKGAAKGYLAPDEEAARREIMLLLFALLAELPESQVEVCRLRYFEGLPPREIARRLGITLNATKMRLKRALATLRNRLSSEAPGGRERWFGILSPLAVPPQSEAPVVLSAGLMTTQLGVLFGVLGLAALLAYGHKSAANSPAKLESSPVVSRARNQAEGGATLSRPSGVGRSPGSHSQSTLQEFPPGGYVVDVSNIEGERTETPVSGTRIQITRSRIGLGCESVPKEFVTETNSSGRFNFPTALRPEPGSAWAFSVGGSPTHSGVTKTVQWPWTQPLRIERKAYEDLSGTVCSREGEPLGGAVVRVMARGTEWGRGTTDRAGKFDIPSLEMAGAIEVDLTGWKLLTEMDARRDSSTAWETPELVMARAAGLQVRVLDPDGEVVEGLSLQVEPSNAEHLDRKSFHLNSGPLGETATTNATGVAEFPDLWAETKLQLTLREVFGKFRFKYLKGQELVIDPALGSRPLILKPGETEIFEVRLAIERSLQGRVLDETGSPAVGAFVDLRTGSSDLVGHPVAEADRDGRFEMKVRAARTAGHVTLRAMDVSPWQVRSHSTASSPRIATMNFDLAAVPESIQLTLEPTWTIQGYLVDHEGVGIQGVLRLCPEERSSMEWKPTGAPVQVVSDRADGSFVFRGLPEGRYDIVARVEERREARVQRVSAGTHGLSIPVEGQPEATVKIFASAAGYELGSLVVMRGDVFGTQGSGQHVDQLGAHSRLSVPFGWPEALLGLHTGFAILHLDGERVTFSLTEAGAENQLLLNPGVYWLGAKGRARDGTRLAPMGTGPICVEEGEHRLEFEMLPLVSMKGRVLGAGSNAAIALAWKDGRLLPLDTGSRERRAVHELGALGHFHFRGVPEGEYELRIGTLQVLESGEADHAQSIRVHRGEPLNLVIDLR